MEVSPLLIILTMFCQNAITSEANPEIKRLIFDLTRPLNELFANEISQQDFCSDVNAAFNLIGTNISTAAIFYATAGSTIEELESRTQNTCNILRETLNMDSDTQLLISWKLNGTIEDKLNFSVPYNQPFDDCSPKLVLHLNSDNECHRILNLFSERSQKLFNTKNGFFGVSNDENVCNLWPRDAARVVNFKFGTTRGVTESFGRFQTRLKFLSEGEGLEFLYRHIIYYPNPQSVGNYEHQNLLIQYAFIWSTSNNPRKSILLQVPSLRKKASKMAQFTVTPFFLQPRKKTGSTDEYIPSSVLWLTASFRRHQMVFVHENSWKLWNTLPKESIKPSKIRRVASKVDFPSDCSEFDCKELNSTSYQPSGLFAGIPTTVFFNIYKGVLPRLPPEIARQGTSKLIFGCFYMIEDSKELNESEVEDVVRSCQSINGSVFILSTSITLQWYNERGEYSFYFENIVRKDLHAINWFRKRILERAPNVKVYLFVDLLEERGYITGPLELKSLFCDEFESSANLYFEGIFNWAKLESFPLVYPFWIFSDWFSFLRKLNYPYPECTLKKKRIDQIQTSFVSSPAFLMQDYLKSAHDWEPDTCIDWTERRWEITDDFFHNPKTGTVFHPSSILNNRSLTQDECITMLNFIFYRFRLVEITIDLDFGNLLAAIEQKVDSRDFNTQIFVKYTMTDRQNYLSEFTSLIDYLRKMFGKEFLKGIHAELVLKAGMNDGKNISNSGNFASVLSMMKHAKLSNVMCGIELPSVKMCNQMLLNLTFSDAYLVLFETVNYLVVKETLKPLKWDDKLNKLYLQDRLDRHLALKRTLDLIIPDLPLYIRVEFDFEIDFENNAKVDRYTSILALFKTFGAHYDIRYFVGNAFDGQSLPKQDGWWGIKNYSDLTNPRSYEEKVTVSRGYPMWYPENLPASPSIPLSNSQDSALVIIVSSVSSAVVIVLLMVGICFGFRYRRLQRLIRFLSDSEVQEFLNGRGCINTDPARNEMELLGTVEHMKFNQECKLDLPDLIIDFNKILGSGAFGTVYKGISKGIPAAIKRPNGDCSRNIFKSVLTEVKVLSYIGNHPNVVGFLGAYVEEIYKGVLYISTELCGLGSLESFLRKKKNVASQSVSNQDQRMELDESVLNFRDVNIFALDIAKGMEYIGSRHVVHGDLSTRNVLLDENLVCKIGDFGLSRKLYEYQKYVKSSQEPLPWKWMAPESLTKMEFTSKTDLWSYGVTLWEIYTLGKIPYAGLNWTVDFANELQNGLRLPNPDFASQEIYAKLLECWGFNPDERPTFADMINFFNGLTEETYMVLNPVEDQHESTTE